MASRVLYQDLIFFKNLIRYKSIDENITEVVIKKMFGYLWYLSPEAAAFLFFDPHLLVDTKRKIVVALKMDTGEDYINRHVINPKKSI